MDVIDILYSHNINKTKARIDVLRFMKKQHRPLSIFEFKKNFPEYNESTLYRNLEIFEQQGIISKVRLNEEFNMFEFNGPNHHHHFVCENCHKITCIDLCGFDLKMKDKLQKLGITQIKHKIEFSGLCKECS